MDKCPFNPGDVVVYAPTSRGRDLLLMTDLANLRPGWRYRISGIEDEVYVIVEGFEKAIPSSLYWTEFKIADDVDCKEDSGTVSK